MTPVPVLIDCDPGIDDAIALLLAFASDEITVEGVTTVAGNVGIAQATANAAQVLDAAGAPPSLPLVPGFGGPLARPERVPDEPVHGPGGLGGVTLPASRRTPAPGGAHAVHRLAAQLRSRPGTRTLIALGPLTNVAGLLHQYPEAAEWVREIVIMGGAAFVPGNVTAAAEFNFHADPEAARYVLESGAPVRLVPLDVTRRAEVTRESADALAALGGTTAYAGRMLAHLADRVAERERAAAERRRVLTGAGWPHGGPAPEPAGPVRTGDPVAVARVHDALAVAAVLRPGLLGWTPAAASVECAGELTRGALVADVHGRTGREMTTLVATDVDADAFAALLAERLASYAEESA
ncbi:nucleoside hydrolase [Actinoallomurus purpureus]|uniref:nucleoside hydrolase n=1 Tax=Actinoallomurus purpureus TaxID=478114 RepID=UPI002093CB8F|nr:nucleoside hydrolase [Actinoallomurus purpureus]MCO6009745.1 nucleoside hydrolase [Actinoallomurus purpureus]